MRPLPSIRWGYSPVKLVVANRLPPVRPWCLIDAKTADQGLPHLIRRFRSLAGSPTARAPGGMLLARAPDSCRLWRFAVLLSYRKQPDMVCLYDCVSVGVLVAPGGPCRFRRPKGCHGISWHSRGKMGGGARLAGKPQGKRVPLVDSSGESPDFLLDSGTGPVHRSAHRQAVPCRRHQKSSVHRLFPEQGRVLRPSSLSRGKFS